jgi:phosphorylcholine metabolism protein LicD
MRRVQFCKRDALSEVKAALLEQLKNFDDYCRTHDIKYFLAGGTCIGAARNGGFLPWDDDADVILLPSEYEKLRETYKKHPIKNFRLIDYRDMDDVENPISSFVNQQGGAHTSSFHLRRKAGGISIDVFRLKPVRDGDTEKNILKHRTLMGLINPKRVYFIPDSREYFSLVLKTYFWSSILPSKLVERLFLSGIYAGPGEDFSCYVINHNIDEGIVYRKELYERSRPRYVPFEDTTLPIADNYVDILWNRFGGSAWRYIPRDQHRRSHAGFIESVKIPHRMIRDDYMNLVSNFKRFDRAAGRSRIANFIKRYRYQRVNEALREMRAGILLDMVERSLVKASIEVSELMAARDYIGIRNAFKAWYRVQFIRRMPQLIDIGDDYLYAICYALVYYEAEYYNAKKIIRWIGEKRAPGERFLELSRLIEIVEQSYYAYDTKNASRLSELLDSAFDEYSTQIDLNILKLQRLSDIAGRTGDYREFQILAERAWEMFPENGDILKLLGDAYRGLGRDDVSLAMYRSALAVTENGLTKKRILDILEEVE